MLNRRKFILSCCALHSMSVGAFAQQKPFVCGTVDLNADSDEKMELQRFTADGAFELQVLRATTDEFKITPYGTANFGQRWRRSDGLTPNTGVITLGVHFLNGGSSERALVQQAAATWLSGTLGTKIKFEFDVVRPRAQITILFGSAGNNSIVGRASATYAQSQATMNLESMVEHVIAHEFGHAIGLQHEHQNPSTAIQWNKPVIIAEMAGQGWTAGMCEANIFARFGKNYACVGSPAFDSKSIMLYPIPAHWTLNGYSTGTNISISNNDRACVVGTYNI